MIPASYLFKDIYRQHWEAADTAPAAIEKSHHFSDGLVTPIAAIAAIFSRRKPRARLSRRHAYE